MTPTTTQVLTVQELRKFWLPYKDRLNRSRDGHPTSIRFHRACSWLEEAERFDADSHVDHRLIFQWTAFNALYGQWDVLRHEAVADRESWQEFLKRMLDLDAAGHLVALLREHRGLTLTILGNAYLIRYFWQAPNGERAGKTGRGRRHKAESWHTAPGATPAQILLVNLASCDTIRIRYGVGDGATQLPPAPGTAHREQSSISWFGATAEGRLHSEHNLGDATKEDGLIGFGDLDSGACHCQNFAT